MTVKPRKSKTHAERVAKWGSTPDHLTFDTFIARMMNDFGVDPLIVASEISHIRRTQGKYVFSSRRILAREKSYHVPLESLPLEFPPIRMQMGSIKNAHVNIEKFYPGGTYKVEYSSKTKGAQYFIKNLKMPASLISSMQGSKISDLIEGLNDDRTIQGIKNFDAGSCVIFTNTDKTSFECKPFNFERYLNVIRQKMPFSNGELYSLDEIRHVEAKSMNKKMFDRKLIEYESIVSGNPDGTEALYILALPYSESKRPHFRVDGFFRDALLNCFLARSDKVNPHQLAASMCAAKSIKINGKTFTGENHPVKG